MIFENPTNLTKITQLLEVADNFTNGVLGILIYIIIGFGSLMLTSHFSMRDGLIVTGFILMFTSYFLWMLSLLSVHFLWLSAVIFVGAVGFSFVKPTMGA